MKREKLTFKVDPVAYVESRVYRELFVRYADLHNGLLEHEAAGNDGMVGAYSNHLRLLAGHLMDVENFWATDNPPSGYYTLFRFLEDAFEEFLDDPRDNFDVPPSVEQVTDTEADIVLRKDASSDIWIRKLKDHMRSFLEKAKGFEWELVFGEPAPHKVYGHYLVINVNIRRKKDAEDDE